MYYKNIKVWYSKIEVWNSNFKVGSINFWFRNSKIKAENSRNIKFKFQDPKGWSSEIRVTIFDSVCNRHIAD